MPNSPHTANSVEMVNIELIDDATAVGTVSHPIALLSVHLREAIRGDGDWCLVHVSVTAHDGSRMPASALADLPLASTVAAIAAEARTRFAASPIREVYPMPPAWRGDRRGRSPRTAEDHALLAQMYAWSSYTTRKGRQNLPHEWSERYGSSVKTWRDRLSTLRRDGYLGRDSDPDQLSDKSLELIYGEGVHDATEMEARIDAWIEIAEQGMTPAEVANAQRNGSNPTDRKARARKIVDQYHPGYTFKN